MGPQRIDVGWPATQGVVTTLEGIPDGSVIVADSAPIIYFLEDHATFGARFAPYFEAAEQGRLEIVISAITLAEVVAGPLQAGNEFLATRYEQALTTSLGWRVVSVDQRVAVQAARLRSVYRLRLPDAIQVATAILTGASALLTHDKTLRRIKEIAIVGTD